MRKSRRSKTIAGYRRRAARRSGRAKLYSASEWKSIARVHRHHFGRRPKKRSYRKNCGMCVRGRNPENYSDGRRMWTFMGYDVFPADRNSSGIRWYSRSGRGYYLKADTKNGMKQLIRAERGNTRYEGNPSKKGLRDRAVKLVESLLYARRNNNIKQEQAAYTKLLDFCQKNNFDFNHVYDGAVKEIKKSIAANMNGLV